MDFPNLFDTSSEDEFETVRKSGRKTLAKEMERESRAIDANLNSYRTTLYLRPQRQLNGGKIEREFFSFINIDSMRIPENSHTSALTIRYEICCQNVVLPNETMISQWLQLKNIYRFVNVHYYFLYFDPHRQVNDPLRGLKTSGISFSIFDRNPMTGQVTPKRLSNDSRRESSLLEVMLKARGCDCRRKTNTD